MSTTDFSDLQHRIEDRLEYWSVEATRRMETDSSVLVFGHRGAHPVVLKVARRQGDESAAGGVLEAFRGSGVVRVLESMEGAVLLEQAHNLRPLLPRRD